LSPALWCAGVEAGEPEGSGKAGVSEPEPREEEGVDDFLVLGLLFIPVVAVWFLLRPRYSRQVRIGAAIYSAAVAIAAVGMVRRLTGL
jgi:hypothetical protein